ncbi:MAG: hypothetical protein JO137_15795 [Hyphomicrobiales bacterium]|nr:hypothetical protein [Hyphomicrobiales bacterium]MBV8428939.1 hypothetical protein [Hyphomicrobiales bacterium]MBV8766249.1 hypothetical protein [Hyphomicrobiales bacterium]MBV9433285.1 hypothetical protein [Hyphomicrobiales bacterium]MBV9738705.1 hypothetical protein [Hyphomicrobiales bacterium]
MNWLDFGAALFGIAAAFLWFRSALAFPVMRTYWDLDGPPPDDHFGLALARAAEMNRWAALATGLSVFCVALKQAIDWWQG